MKFGPGRESPSRLQRWLLRQRAWVIGALLGALLGVGFTAAIWFRQAELVLPVAVIVPLLAVVVGAVVFGASSDRHVTGDERLDKTVAYFPTSPVDALRALRRPYVVLIGLGSLYAGIRSLIEASGGGLVAGVLFLVLAALCVLALLTPAGDG